MTAALFPGQGSEREGMLSVVTPDFLNCIKNNSSANGNTELETQFNIYAVSASLWKDSGRKYGFTLMAGHSLGFYSALFASGSIDFETGIYLIQSAYKAISETAGKGSFGMTAIIGIKWDIIEDLCNGYENIHVANINSATQVVVSGNAVSLDHFEKTVIDKGALKVIRLPVKYPLHTPILRGVSDVMRECVKDIKLKKPEIPVVDHTSGEILSSSERLMETLVGQFSRKVVWRDVIKNMRGQGINRFVEVGPGDVLSKITRWIERDAEAISLDVQI